MWCKLNLEGMKIELNIRKYKPYDPNDEDINWCEVDYSFSFPNCINYSRKEDEVLMTTEVEQLKCALDDFINKKITSEYELGFAEPDFEFVFMPSINLLESGKVIYAKPGFEMSAPVVEWKVNLWCEGLTDNYFSTTLGVEDIVILRDYIRVITGEMDADSRIIQEYIEKGFIGA